MVSTNSPLNTQMIDLGNRVWHVFDTCHVSKYAVQLKSCALHQYTLDDFWEGNSFNKHSSYDIFTTLCILFYHQSNNAILCNEDVITNKGNPHNNEFCEIDVIDTTSLIPGWGIIKHEDKHYVASINLEKESKITLTNFFLINGFDQHVRQML